MSLLQDFLTREQAAAELHVTPRTLSRWQAKPDGLPYVEMGGRILYRRQSILAWIESCERRPNARRSGGKRA
jgi:hypothetical protein